MELCDLTVEISGGHDARLSIFRILVKAGEDGCRVGEIGAMLGLAPSTLAHHLSALVDAGLIVQVKQGREVLMVFDPVQAGESALFAGSALLRTAPFLILSIGVAAWAVATGADNLIAKAFTGAPLVMIALGALAGGLSPFCSCGVIPLIAAMLAMGVPLSAVMAFWLASPLMDPSMFVLTAGVLNLEFRDRKNVRSDWSWCLWWLCCSSAFARRERWTTRCAQVSAMVAAVAPGYAPPSPYTGVSGTMQSAGQSSGERQRRRRFS